MKEMKDSGIEWIGEIPKNNNLIRNKYFINYVKGKIPNNTNEERIGKPYIGASDLENGCYSIYTTDDLPQCSKDDTLILWDGARAGLIGTGHEGIISSTVVNVLPNKRCIDKKFWYWYIKGFEWFLISKVGGTTIPHMNRKYIEELNFIDFTIDEQIKIANFLDDKCDKIDRMIAKEQEEIDNLKEYKLSKIDELLASEAGASVHLGYISNLKNGLNFNVVLDGEPMKFLGVGNFKDNYILNSEKMFSDILVDGEIDDDFLLRNGDIVFVRSNGSKELVGRAIMVENISFPLTYSGFCIRFRNTRPDILNNKYLLYYFRSPYFRRQLEKYSQGSNISNINQNLLSHIHITILPMNEQQTIVNKVEKLSLMIDKLKDEKEKKLRKLEEYKNSIIYEVVTGKKGV